ncbi:hypothetical protein [Streptomyces sp. NPDC051776]
MIRAEAPRVAQRLIHEVFDAPDEQTVGSLRSLQDWHRFSVFRDGPADTG